MISNNYRNKNKYVWLLIFVSFCFLLFMEINAQDEGEVDTKALAKKYFKSAQDYIKEGNYVTAVFELEKALEYDPYLAEAWYNLGILYGKNEVVVNVDGALERSINALERFLEVVDNPDDYKAKVQEMIRERKSRAKKLRLANALKVAENDVKVQNAYNKLRAQYYDKIVSELQNNAKEVHTLNVDKKLMEYVQKKISLLFKCRTMEIENKSNEIVFVMFFDKEKFEVLGGAALDVKESESINIPVNRDILFYITYSSKPGMIYDGGEELFFDDVVDENGALKPDRILSVNLTINTQENGISLEIKRAEEKKKVVG